MSPSRVKSDANTKAQASRTVAPAMLAREVERKFAAPSQSVIDNLARIDRLAGFQLQPPKTTVNHDVYLDTPDFALLRRGLSLRLRRARDRARLKQGGDMRGQETLLVTLKGLADGNDDRNVLNRLELEGPAATGIAFDDLSRRLQVPTDADWLPTEIREHLSGLGLLKKRQWRKGLRAYLILQQSRIKRIGHTPLSHMNLEMSLDRVAVYALEDGAFDIQTADAPLAEFHEIEFEALVNGADDAETYNRIEATLHDLDREPALQGVTNLTVSKLERGLRLWGGLDAERSPLDSVASGFQFAGTTEMHAALREIWRTTLVELLLLEHGIRADQDMEYVHQMRVSIRRARTAARFLGNGFKPKALAPLLAGMRNLARLLGKVRDYDVALANLDEHAGSRNGSEKSDSKKAQKARIRIRARRQKARRREYDRLIDWLDGKQYAAFIAALRDFCIAEPHPSSLRRCDAQKPARTQVRHVFPALLMEQYTKVRLYEAYLLNHSAKAESAVAAENASGAHAISEESLHALRIEFKRLRYALESCRHLLPEHIDKFLARLRKMQELLGEINDTSVEIARLGDRKNKADALRHAELMQHMAALREQLPRRFSPLVTYKTRRRLYDAIARL